MVEFFQEDRSVRSFISREETMRFDMGMVRRGLVVTAIAALFGGWTMFAAKEVINDVGRTVAFGLKPKTFVIAPARPEPALRPQRVDGTHKTNRLPVADPYKLKRIYFPNCAVGTYCAFAARA
jgi:hypothetical protein